MCDNELVWLVRFSKTIKSYKIIYHYLNLMIEIIIICETRLINCVYIFREPLQLENNRFSFMPDRF